MRLTEIDGKSLQARKRLDRGMEGHSETDRNPVQAKKARPWGEMVLGQGYVEIWHHFDSRGFTVMFDFNLHSGPSDRYGQLWFVYSRRDPQTLS